MTFIKHDVSRYLSEEKELNLTNRVIYSGFSISRHSAIFWASQLVRVVKNLSAMQKTWVQSLGWEDALE